MKWVCTLQTNIEYTSQRGTQAYTIKTKTKPLFASFNTNKWRRIIRSRGKTTVSLTAALIHAARSQTLQILSKSNTFISIVVLLRYSPVLPITTHDQDGEGKSRTLNNFWPPLMKLGSLISQFDHFCGLGYKERVHNAACPLIGVLVKPVSSGVLLAKSVFPEDEWRPATGVREHAPSPTPDNFLTLKSIWCNSEPSKRLFDVNLGRFWWVFLWKSEHLSQLMLGRGDAGSYSSFHFILSNTFAQIRLTWPVPQAFLPPCKT